MGLLEKTTINAEASVKVASKRKTMDVIEKSALRNYAFSLI